MGPAARRPALPGPACRPGAEDRLQVNGPDAGPFKSATEGRWEPSRSKLGTRTYNYVGLFTPGAGRGGLTQIDQAFSTDDDGTGGRFVPEFKFPVLAGQEIDILVSNDAIPQNFRLILGLTPDGITVDPPPPPPATLPTASIATVVSPASAAMGVKGRAVVTLSAPAAADVSVPYTVGGTAVGGVDYKTLSGIAFIPAGQSAASIKVKPILLESFVPLPSRKIKLRLQPGVGYTLSEATLATVKVQ